MNVLFLCQRVPYPPDRGDRITTWHFLQHLLKQGARIRLGCFSEEDRDEDSVAFLRERGIEVFAPRLTRSRWQTLASMRGLLTGEALTLPFFRNRLLQQTVDRWLEGRDSGERPDLVYVYSSSMAQYVLGRRGPRKVMQFAELDSDKWRQFALRSGPLGRWIYGREARTLLAFEDRVARDFDLSMVVSDVERDLFERRIPGVTPAVLPNGVAVDQFVSAGDDAREAHALVFTGVMDYEPNVDGICWFVQECWLDIRRSHPDAKLFVVGSKPTPAVQALTASPGVEVTGRVPETQPWFDRASVAIAPLRLARGVQNKVLEAMSMGLPVVSTPQAAQGLGDVPAGTVQIAASSTETVEAIRRLFEDPAAARRQGEAGAAWVRGTFRWENMYARLDEQLAGLGLELPSRSPRPHTSQQAEQAR